MVSLLPIRAERYMPFKGQNNTILNMMRNRILSNCKDGPWPCEYWRCSILESYALEFAKAEELQSWMNLIEMVRYNFPLLERDDDEKGVATRALYRSMGFKEAELLVEHNYPHQKSVLHRA